jgi:hypothetical protein
LLLVFDRKTNYFRLLNRSAGGFIGRGYNEIRKRAPLNFRGAFQARHYLVRQTRLQAGGARGLTAHTVIIRRIAVRRRWAEA